MSFLPLAENFHRIQNFRVGQENITVFQVVFKIILSVLILKKINCQMKLRLFYLIFNTVRIRFTYHSIQSKITLRDIGFKRILGSQSYYMIIVFLMS